MDRSAHAADHVSFCGRVELSGQGSHCNTDGNDTIPTCGTDCLACPSTHFPFPPFSNNLPVLMEFYQSNSCLARVHMYHPALQISVAMLLNYSNGMSVRRLIYLCILRRKLFRLLLTLFSFVRTETQMQCWENNFDNLYEDI